MNDLCVTFDELNIDAICRQSDFRVFFLLHPPTVRFHLPFFIRSVFSFSRPFSPLSRCDIGWAEWKRRKEEIQNKKKGNEKNGERVREIVSLYNRRSSIFLWRYRRRIKNNTALEFQENENKTEYVQYVTGFPTSYCAEHSRAREKWRGKNIRNFFSTTRSAAWHFLFF